MCLIGDSDKIFGDVESGATFSKELKFPVIQAAKNNQNAYKPPTPAAGNLEYERAKCILNEACEADGAKCVDEAVALYTQAIELLLKIHSRSSDASFKERVNKLATQALERAETLKQLKKTLQPSSANFSNLSVRSRSPQPQPPGSGYSKEELRVLKSTSTINGREYLPFLDYLDNRERFAFPQPFTDSHGMLALSQKQGSLLSRWVRPSDFAPNPQMIMAVSCFPIRQTVVTDCSFVASMAVAAQYERRFNRRLITNIIYPQKANGEPVYNPCGKYMVIVDDYLPMGYNDELLCSFSTNRSELWVSFLEKAYMKVMGGYDFPGSNSNIDLHALTGWIPERVPIKPSTGVFNADREYRRLASRFHQGHCLVTVATGVLSPSDESRSGLVPTHAYALLDMQEVGNTRLLLLENPWSRTKWKGNYSDQDKEHWTTEMQKRLNFDVNVAQYVDNGVFWIDYKSLCHFFDVFYINWNPDLFPYTTCVHSEWSAATGPKKDIYSYANNPQYTLEVRTKTQAPVWILLTRHITNKNDFANNNEFIAVVVYKNISGRKVYYPNEPQPYKDSVRINSPHCLIQMVQEPGAVTYTLVVSQYEKNMNIQYTLRAYSTAPLSLVQIKDPYTCSKTITGAWKGANAAGCPNHDNFELNPTYEISLNNRDSDNQLLIEMRGPREFAVGFQLSVSSLSVAPINHQEKMSTGSYRRGYTMMELAGLAGGKYQLIVATFEPRQEGPFIISLRSLRPVEIRCMQ
ncbi:calpain 7 [Sparganum proliferum]